MMKNKNDINQSLDLFDTILYSIEQMSIKHNYDINRDNTYIMLITDITEIDMEHTYKGIPCTSTILQLIFNRLNSFNMQKRKKFKYQIKNR